MNPSIKISVVMPSYNSENYILASIESILGQTFCDFELIVVDDASTDATVEIVSQMRDKRIKLVQKQVNSGNYPTRNIGNKLAKGSYIAVMDSDDIALPNRLNEQYLYMESNPKVGLVGANAEMINSNSEKLGYTALPTENQQIKLSLLRSNCFVHSTLFYRRKDMRRHNFSYNEEIKLSSDYDFIVNFSRKTAISNLDATLIKYRLHEQQLSHQKQMQQSYYADQVRLKQLNRFRIKYSPTDLALHMKIMHAIPLTEPESRHAYVWCNKLMEANVKCKIYNHLTFYHFLAKTLQAVDRK